MGVIEFELKLVDDISKPLSEVDESVHETTKGLEAMGEQAKLADAALGKLARDARGRFLPRGSAGFGGSGGSSRKASAFGLEFSLPSFDSSIAGGFLFAKALSFIGREAEFAAKSLIELSVDAPVFKANAVAVEGEELFKAVDAAARQAHLPVEHAHKIAQSLLEEGVEDTGLIANIISAKAALIRTGQERGAEKLQAIIEKSLASGHFEVRGLDGGKGGAPSGRALAGLGIEAPALLDSLAKHLNTSVGNVRAELKAGKISAEVGIAAIADAVNSGSIGKAARARFDLKDFATDASNAFRSVAQDSSLAIFNQALVDAGGSIDHLTNAGSPLREIFQVIVNGTGGAIEKVTIFALEAEGLYLDLRLATKGMGDFGNAAGDTGGMIGTIASGAFSVLKTTLVEIVEYADDVGTAFEEAGAAIGYFFSAKAGDKGADTSLFETLDKMDIELQKRQRNRAHVLDGSNAIPLGPELGPGQNGAGPGVDEPPLSIRRPKGFASGGVVPEPMSPDSVFVAARPGERILPKDFDLSSLVTSLSVRSQGPSSANSGPSIHIEQIVIGREDASRDGEHLRPLLESAFVDALERVALELGA